jgi:putative beta barrel porin BBP7
MNYFRGIFIFTLLLGTIVTARAGDDVDGKDVKNVSGASVEDPENCGPWYFEAGGVFFQRENLIHNQALAYIIGAGGVRNQAMSTDAVDLTGEYEASPKIMMGYRINDVSAFEGSYFGFGLMHWKQQAQVLNAGGNLDVELTNLTNDFDGANAVSVEQRSDFNHNAELVYRRDLPDICQWLSVTAGVRYLNINEQFDIRSRDGADESLYSIETTNDLVGIQIGADVSYPIDDVFSVDFTGKAGPYANVAHHRTFFGDNNNTTTIRGFEVEQVNPAFVGETGLSLVANIDNCFKFKIGYQAIYIYGLAMAQDQINFNGQRGPIGTNTEEIETNGTAIYHGIMASIGFPWFGEWDLPQSIKD